MIWLAFLVRLRLLHNIKPMRLASKTTATTPTEMPTLSPNEGAADWEITCGVATAALVAELVDTVADAGEAVDGEVAEVDETVAETDALEEVESVTKLKPLTGTA
jgi:hypothetical protein